MRGLLNFIAGVLLIIAGASGQMVLRGTNSSFALIILGVVVAAFGSFQMFAANSQKQKYAAQVEAAKQQAAVAAAAAAEAAAEAAANPVAGDLSLPATVILKRTSKNVIVKDVSISLNGIVVGNLDSGGSLQFKTGFSHNQVSFTNAGFTRSFDFEASSGGQVNLILKQTFKDGLHFAIDDSAA
ncbi:MAG: hypothetical protein LBR25_01835 [Erysipelotrichaceae bacterium]|jgi:hypothetical protein|nr:hypothetical protein [Erysipelotrichaceae bacterium]